MHAREWVRGAGILALVLVLPACGGVGRNSPPELLAGRDACRECGMLISELRFAAGYVDDEGISYGFDDLGCLARYTSLHKEPGSPATMWVADYRTRAWVRAADAWFARCDSVVTPMGYGVVAVEDSAQACELAGHGTAAFRYDTLSRHVSLGEQPGAALEGAAKKE